jgi:Raf kinase inhibitor-like YbhB/YbcL family protein
MRNILMSLAVICFFTTTGGAAMALEIKSPAFEDGGSIPEDYTCKGRDVSPPLTISGVPKGAASLALICDDPDAPMGAWVHWVIYNMPAGTEGLEEDVPKVDKLPNGALQGMTDFRRVGYGGPCPPPGGPHRYYFKLYALDSMLGLKSGATKKALLEAMKGHIIAEAQLMGKFKR